MARMVKCVKFGKELPGLPRPPIPGELGKRIFENVSEQAWGLWQQQSTLLINHYGLNLRDPDAQKFLMKQMEEFLWTPVDSSASSGTDQKPEDWIPEDQAPPTPRKK